MNKERLIELAKQAGWEYADDDRGFEPLWRFAALVRADEREVLHSLKTDAHYIFNNTPSETTQDVRDVIEWYDASIRARGETK